MYKKLSFVLLLLFFANHNYAQEDSTFKIAFGSCGHQNDSLSIFYDIVKHQPDIFVFLGDNIYGDTESMDTLSSKYEQLAKKPSYQHLKENVEIIATWDDHDYGWNDAGRNYKFKKESKEIFLEFFEEPDTSTRRTHEGIYHSYEFVNNGKKIQIILLDGRTFRDDLKEYGGEFKNDHRNFYKLYYSPHPDST